MIHLILGKQGSGKTLYLVMKAYEYYKLGYNIYSNVHLTYKLNKKPDDIYKKGVKYKELNPEKYNKLFGYYYLDYNDIVDCKLENAIVIIDEIHLLLSARNSISKHSREICDGFLSMVRKKGLNVYGTTQTLRKVDVRFREEADYIYDTTKKAYINNNWVEVLHNQNLDIKIPIMINLSVTETESLKTRNINFIANFLFNKYDTREIIKVRGLK